MNTDKTSPTSSNIDIMRAAFDAFARGDLAAVLSIFDPELEWREADNFIYADGNPYRGPEAVRDGVFARIARDWDGYEVRVEEMHDAGDTVIANGKLMFFQQYTDTAQFRDAAT